MKNVQSTVSNLAYFVGALVSIASNTPYGWSIGFILVYLGITSWGFHATEEWKWQRLDRAGVYAIGFVAALKLILIPWWVGVPVAIGMGAAAYRWPHIFDSTRDMVTVFACAVVGTSLLGYWGILTWYATAICVLFFGTAGYMRLKEGKESHGPMHPWWHMVTGIGFGIIGAADFRVR